MSEAARLGDQERPRGHVHGVSPSSKKPSRVAQGVTLSGRGGVTSGPP